MPFDANAQPAIGNKPNLAECDAQGGTFCPGAPWALCITPAPNQFLYVSDAHPGRIYKLTLDGKVLGVLGEAGKAGFTKWPARRRTWCSRPKSSTGASRS
jgi:hypothetical protein